MRGKLFSPPDHAHTGRTPENQADSKKRAAYLNKRSQMCHVLNLEFFGPAVWAGDLLTVEIETSWTEKIAHPSE